MLPLPHSSPNGTSTGRITTFPQTEAVLARPSSLLFSPADRFQMSVPRAKCIKTSIWMPFLYGHPVPVCRPGPVAQGAGEELSQGDEDRLEVRQSGDEGGDRAFPWPHPSRGVGENVPAEQDRIFLGRWGSCGVCLH